MIISTVLVTICLFLAVGTWRLIVPILVTLTVGMLLTLLYATLAVGTLNVISIAFGILYVGMAVDYGMQFSVRFREYRLTTRDTAAAMAMTTRLAGPQIAFAAATTAAGFMAFLPTDFRGVAELGLIAGGSMIIAFLCTLTVMPAVIALCRPRGEAEEVGYAWAARLDPLIVRIRWPIVGLFAGLALVGLALIPLLTFDADPLHTKRQDTEAVSTLRELIESPLTNPYTIEILASDQAVVTRLSERLKALPIVSGVISLFSFIPADQAAKLALIADASTILAPTLQAPSSVAPVTPEDIRLAASTALAQIEPALAKLPSDHPLADIARDLKALVAAPVPTLVAANLALTRFLPEQLDRLRAALSAEPVTRATIPAEVARDWVAPDGRYRLLVNATQEALSRGAVKDFARAVLAVAPEAAGPAVTIDASSDTITGAFEAAALYSLFGITFLLWIAQRRSLDVTLVLAPLLLSAALALVVVVAIGMPLNFANIIALPLLLCAGVAYNVYFVMNWRQGLTNPLGSATFRAVLFAALTDLEAFGALAVSGHPGTSSMGVMLLISLGCTLITTVLFLPALLAVIGRPNGASRA
jgi:hopanoid biosynthesis associated RND transporter like protein HpnN